MNVRKINESRGIAVILYPDQFNDFKLMIDMLKKNMGFYAVGIANYINERWDK